MKRIIVWCMAMVLAGALLLPLQAGAENNVRMNKDNAQIIIRDQDEKRLDINDPRIIIRDQDGKPLDNKEFILKDQGGKTVEGILHIDDGKDILKETKIGEKEQVIIHITYDDDGKIKDWTLKKVPISPIVPKPPKPDCRDYPTCLQHPVCIADSRCKPKEVLLPCNVPCWNYPACLKCASCEGDPQCQAQAPKKPKTPQIKVPKPTEGVIIVVPGQVEKVEKKEKKYKEVVKVKGKSKTQGHFVRRGSSWEFPIMPARTFTIPGRPGGPARSVFVLQMRVVKMVLIIIDPVIAVGYDYFVDKGPKVTEIELPEGIGDNLYELWLFDNGANDFVNTGVTIVGGEPYTLSEPVDKFSIRGIEVDAGLDPEDELAFPTGLKFVDSGEVEMRMISITVDTDQE